MLNLLLDRSDGNVPINFVRSIVHLYKALECTTTDKEKKIQLAKKLALFIEKECKKITKLTDESEIEEIYE